MKKLSTFLVLVLSYYIGFSQAINLTNQGNATYVDNNGLSGNCGVTFVIENTNTGPVILRSLGAYLTAAQNGGNIHIWYHPTSLTGTVAAVNTANGWIRLDSVMGVVATASNYVTLFNNTLSLIIPGGTTYRFYVQSSAGIRYSGLSAPFPTPNVFTSNGVSFAMGDFQISGTAVGFAGSNNAATIANRFFMGSVGLDFANACTAPPVAGVSNASPNPVCQNGNVALSLTGSSFGTGLTYQWQSSPDSIVWTNIPGATNSSASVPTALTTFYRCVLTCNNVSDNSVPVKVNITPGLAGGTYTIGATGTYPTLTAAVNALSCGILGPIVFNVLPNSGPYNEQMNINSILGASATNTVTFNFNNNTIAFNPPTTNIGIITLNGADYVSINDANITTTTNGACVGVLLNNNADFNTVNNCNFNLLSVTSTISACVASTGSFTSVSTTGSTANNFTLTNSNLRGGYYSARFNGSTTTFNNNHLVSNNLMENFNVYGIYTFYVSNSNFLNNRITRPTVSQTSSFYGIYMTSGGVNNLIESNRIYNSNGTSVGSNLFYGISILSCDAPVGQENKFYNNAIYRINNSGTAWGIYNSSSDGLLVYHNTIVVNEPQITGSGTFRGIYQITAATNNEYRNNIISHNRGTTGLAHLMYFGTTTSSIISNNNIFSIGTGTNEHIGFYSTNQTTLASWQAVNSAAYDQLSIVADPQFSSYTNGILIPNNTSINDLGAAVGVAFDINGNIRSAATPDPGAWEFTPMPNDAGATALISPPNGVSGGGIDSIRVAITNFGTSNLNSAQIFARISQGANVTTIGPVNFTGSLNPQQQSGSINIGAFNFVSGYYQLKIWTTNPNGNTDMNSLNDTLNTSVCVGLAGTYTINPSGGNFTSIGQAVSALACGINGAVVFNVAANSGPYSERVVIPVVPNSSSINTITFNGNQNEINFAPSTTDYGIVRFQGVRNLTFNNFKIRNTSTVAGHLIQIGSESRNITIQNCELDNMANINVNSTLFNAISVSGSNISATTATSGTRNIRIVNNKIYNAGYYGISAVCTAGDSSNIHIINNEIYDFSFYGMYLSNTFADSIVGNIITRPNRSVVSTTYGIYLLNPGSNHLIMNNRIYGLFDNVTGNTSTTYPIFVSGVDAVASAPNRMINNAAFRNNNNGAYYGIYNTSSDNWQYYHNSIVLDDTLSTATVFSYGFYQITAAIGQDLKNNIFMVRRGGTGTKVGLYFATAGTTFTSNYNNVFVSGSNSNFGFLNSLQATLTDWQTATTQDANTSIVDPQFVQTSSPVAVPSNLTMNNTGTPVGVATDISGTVRGTVPDMGAYEFDIINKDIQFMSITTPNFPCVSISDTILVSIKNTGALALNFATDTLKLNYQITGSQNYNGTRIINAGTLAPGATANFALVNTAAFIGNTNYNVAINNFSNWDNFVFNNQFNGYINVVRPTLSFATDSICFGDSILLTANNFSGQGQWQFSSGSGFSNITGLTASSTYYSPTQTGIYRFNYCNTLFSDTDGIAVITTVPPSTQGTTVCSGSNATVSAQGNGNIFWYSSLTSNTPIGTGANYTATNITQPTTVFAQIGGGNTSLITTFAAGNASSGNMFEVEAVSSVKVTRIDGHDPSAIGTQSTWEIWYRPNKYTLDPTATTSNTNWILLGQATGVPSAGAGQPTIIPINLNITIPTGQTYSFYVTKTSGTVNYTNGIAVGTLLAQDQNIKVFEGHGGSYFGVTITTRNFNGRINYQAGCESARVPALINVHPAAQTTLPQQADLCAGSSISVSPGAGFNAYNWSNGDTTSSININTPGTYTVTVTDNNNCQTTNSVVVSSIPSPIIYLGNDTTVCSNTNFTLDAGTGFASYLWSNGNNNQIVNVNTSGNISVVVTDTNGCAGTDTINVTVNQAPNPQLSNTVLCDNSNVTLNPGTAQNLNYNWSNGASTPTITVSVAGLYTVTVTDGIGCAGNAQAIVDNTTTPALNLPATLTLCADRADTIIGQTGYANYVWYNGSNTTDLILAANTFQPGQTANIWLNATGNDGCTVSDTIRVSFVACTVGLDEIGNTVMLNIYPNPNHGNFIIETLNIQENCRLEISDLSGKVIFENQLSVQNSKIAVSLTNQAKGLYLVRVIGKGKQNVFKLSVQ